MSVDNLEKLRAEALEHVSEGRVEEACRSFQQLVEREPDVPEGWINLATAERALGQLHVAAEHYRKGIDLLKSAGSIEPGLLASALHAFGLTLEGLELSDAAAAAYRESADRDPRAPTPLSQLALLLARAGHLAEADRVASEYCMAAVSILAEKGHIGQVRRFQKALKQASTVDGNRLLIATREAYVRGFEETVQKLPPGAQLEAEPHGRDPQGNLRPMLANPKRPWSRVRFDAIDPASGERWMIQEAPTYGFPQDCPAASEGFFSVPHKVELPFPVLIATRTAWDYFFVRLRFMNGLSEEAIRNAESLIGEWYLRGMDGQFGEGGKGFFHFLSEPFAIGDEGLRYEVDLGRSQLDAVPALFETLAKLHQVAPLEVVVLGDGMLPLRGPVPGKKA